MNDAFLNTTGYTHEEALGKTTVDLHIWRTKENRDVMIEELSRCGRAQNVEGHFLTKSGEQRTGLVSADIITINDEASILSSIIDITERKRSEEERNRLILELQEALANIKTLKGLIPICAWCKKIRDDNGYWSEVEAYFKKHSDAEFLSRHLSRMQEEGTGGDAVPRIVEGLEH